VGQGSNYEHHSKGREVQSNLCEAKHHGSFFDQASSNWELLACQIIIMSDIFGL
jgi:hypothetical protein